MKLAGAVRLGTPAFTGAASLWQLALMPCRCSRRAATPQIGGGRGIVRGQTLISNETGRQTQKDVICIWSVQIRQGEIDLPGRSTVRPTPNCRIVAGVPNSCK